MSAPVQTAISRARCHIKNITGYTIKDDKLLRAVISDHRTVSFKETRRLAMLGDHALRAAILTKWYPTGRDVRDAATLMLEISSNRRLSLAGNKHGVNELIIREGPARVARLGEKPKVVMGTVMEAMVGAIFLEHRENVEVVNDVIRKLGLHLPEPPRERKKKGKKSATGDEGEGNGEGEGEGEGEGDVEALDEAVEMTHEAAVGEGKGKGKGEAAETNKSDEPPKMPWWATIF